MRVLVVEDDKEIRSMISKVITKSGDCVMAVGALSHMSRAILSHAPDVIILDLGLPDSNGPATLKHVQDMVVNIAIIVYSANSEWTQECLDMGADEFLLKGAFSPKDIPAVISSAVGHHNLKRVVSKQYREPGPFSFVPVSDISKVSDRLIDMAGELRALAAEGG